jgi:hypothetical protein
MRAANGNVTTIRCALIVIITVRGRTADANGITALVVGGAGVGVVAGGFGQRGCGFAVSRDWIADTNDTR